MTKQIEEENLIGEAQTSALGFVDFLRSFCGHDCSKCVTYIATITDDGNLKLQSQKFYKEKFDKKIPLEKFNCEGCRTDNVFKFCRDCPFKKCCIERNISSCNLCHEYPCDMLNDYQKKYVNKCNQIKEK